MKPDTIDLSLATYEESLIPYDQQYQQYGYRWVSTGIYMLSAISASMMVQACTPIVEELSETYEVSTTIVKVSALIFMLTHPVFTIFANWVVESKGLKFALNLAAALLIFGLGLRILVNYSFYWVIAGSVFCSAGNVFVLNTPAKVAANWWFPKNRVAVTTACTFAGMISGAVGTSMPVIFFDKNDAIGKASFQRLMIFQEILIGSIFLLNVLLFRESPPSPPSYSSMQPRQPFLTATPQLFMNPQYMKLFGVVVLIMGALNSFFVNIESWMKPFGFEPKDVSIMSIGSTLMGIAGSVVSVLFVRRYKRYKLTIGLYIVLGILGMGGLTASLYTGSVLVMSLVCGVAAFALYPIISNCVELGCEIVYPIGEATSTGTMLAGGQIMSFITGVLISEQVVDGVSKFRSVLNGTITCSMLGVALILNLLIKVRLNREIQDNATSENKVQDV